MTSSKDKSKINYRRTKLLINAAFENDKPLTPLGHIVLIEDDVNPGPDGKFTLHFIKIMDPYQGKGYGSTALDLTIMLAQSLARQSDFYDCLSLQCSDYDGTTHLGNMPNRLTYYLNHGFQIDQTTLDFMRHLDVSYFVQSFDIDNFITFLKDYTSQNHPLDSYIPYAETILARLKEAYTKATPLSADARLQIAESSSSDAALCILDRLYFDPRLDDETQGKTGKLINKMSLNVKEWPKAIAQRKHLLSNRRKSKSRNTNNKYNPNELNDLLMHIFNIYTQFIDTGVEDVKTVTCAGDEDRLTKLRKVSSSDDTYLFNAPSIKATVSSKP